MAEQKQSEDFKYFIRVANTDLDGKKTIYTALTKVKGVSFMISNAVLGVAGVDKSLKAGNLSDTQVKKIDETLSDLTKANIPKWMYNKQKEPASGEDKHLLVGDLRYDLENDIKRLKRIKSYRGIRHGVGLPLRGQRTKSNFRRNKGKGSLGVKKREGAKKGR